MKRLVLTCVAVMVACGCALSQQSVNDNRGENANNPLGLGQSKGAFQKPTALM